MKLHFLLEHPECSDITSEIKTKLKARILKKSKSWCEPEIELHREIWNLVRYANREYYRKIETELISEYETCLSTYTESKRHMMTMTEIEIIKLIRDCNISTKADRIESEVIKSDISKNIEVTESELKSDTGVCSKVETYTNRTILLRSPVACSCYRSKNQSYQKSN